MHNTLAKPHPREKTMISNHISHRLQPQPASNECIMSTQQPVITVIKALTIRFRYEFFSRGSTQNSRQNQLSAPPSELIFALLVLHSNKRKSK